MSASVLSQLCLQDSSTLVEGACPCVSSRPPGGPFLAALVHTQDLSVPGPRILSAPSLLLSTWSPWITKICIKRLAPDPSRTIQHVNPLC